MYVHMYIYIYTHSTYPYIASRHAIMKFLDIFAGAHQRVRGIFALIVAGTFCGQLGLSILTPFFPTEAKSKLVKDDPSWGGGRPSGPSARCQQP